VQIDKETIVNVLRERGETQQAGQAQRELPDQVDTDRDRNLLERFGIDPSDVLSRVSGGRDVPGL
jgi:hypothetical protein